MSFCVGDKVLLDLVQLGYIPVALLGIKLSVMQSVTVRIERLQFLQSVRNHHIELVLVVSHCEKCLKCFA